MADKAAMREMMRLHRESKGKTKISDPLARYSPAGELFCVLCNTPVKSEGVWTAHIHGRAHKSQLQALRSRSGEPASGTVIPSSKREPPPSTTTTTSTSDANGGSAAGQKRKFAALVQDYSDDESDSEEEAVAERGGKRVKTADPPPTQSRAPISNLPPGFFDSGMQPSAISNSVEAGDHEEEMQDVDTAKQVDTRTLDEKLPEGFFDDKKQDAKARKIEYVDPQQAEYEKFQAAMLQADIEAEVLMDQDDDERKDERLYAELQETVTQAQRVDTIQDVRQKLLVSRNARQAANDASMDAESDSGDDSDNDMFDWRAKKISRKV